MNRLFVYYALLPKSRKLGLTTITIDYNSIEYLLRCATEIHLVYGQGFLYRLQYLADRMNIFIYVIPVFSIKKKWHW